MEEKLRQRDAMSEKLRLKNTALKGQLQKVFMHRTGVSLVLVVAI